MIKHTSILKLEVRHSYFTNGVCTDLRFSPMPETQDLIAGRRLLVKYRPAGLEVFAPLDVDDKLLVPVEKNLLFQWMLLTQSAEFYSATELPPKDSIGHYSFSNVMGEFGTSHTVEKYGGLINADDQSDSAGTRSLVRPFSFTHLLEAGKAKQTVKLNRKPVLGVGESDFVFEKALESDSPDPGSITVTAIKNNTLELSMSPLPQKTPVKITYPVAAKGAKNGFALVGIRLEKAFTKKTDKGMFYTLNLLAKKEQWQYLILTDKTTVLDLNGPWKLKMPNGTSPQEIKARALDQNTAPENTHAMAGLIWDRLKTRIDPNNENAYFFYSEEPLPIKEKPLTDLVIQYGKGGDVWEDVFTDLLAPTPQSQGVQIIKHTPTT